MRSSSSAAAEKAGNPKLFWTLFHSHLLEMLNHNSFAEKKTSCIEEGETEARVRLIETASDSAELSIRVLSVGCLKFLAYKLLVSLRIKVVLDLKCNCKISKPNCSTHSQLFRVQIHPILTKKRK